VERRVLARTIFTMLFMRNDIKLRAAAS